ncbi:MAG: hypothetical protein KDD32_09610 [Bacteroidetes bacterium]|nr:hypothetical protein [Bacteroidota bacterium]
MKIKYLLPMITWVIPTIIISLIMFKLDAPLTPTQNIGFAALLISACITYVVGIRIVMNDK